MAENQGISVHFYRVSIHITILFYKSTRRFCKLIKFVLKYIILSQQEGFWLFVAFKERAIQSLAKLLNILLFVVVKIFDTVHPACWSMTQKKVISVVNVNIKIQFQVCCNLLLVRTPCFMGKPCLSFPPVTLTT